MTTVQDGAAIIAGDKEASRSWWSRIFPIVFALVYAATLACLPIDMFKDRANYFSYANYSDIILVRYIIEGPLSVLANEPLWLLLNIYLFNFFDSYDTVKIIIFVPAFFVSWKLLKRTPLHAIWMIVFLLAPQVVQNHIIHLRQGVALSVFMLGYYAKPPWLRYGLMFASGFIHSAFLIVSAIGVATWAISRLRLPPKLQIAALSACLMVLGVLVNDVAGGLGARQFYEYAGSDLSISGIGFIFWAVILLVFLTSGDDYLKINIFPVANLIFYLVLYFVSPVSARVFESGLFMVFQSGLALPDRQRNVFLSAFTIYTIFQYILRFGQHGLGWGIWA